MTKIPKIELYGVIRFNRNKTYKQRCLHSYLIIELNKITCKGIDYIPEDITLGIQVSPEIYNGLMEQTEKTGGKLKIKIKADLEAIVKINDE